MARLEIGVWQFVRIMVELEEGSSRKRGGSNTIYQTWREPWNEVDQRLTDLAETDQNAYSDLMMNQEIVLECAQNQIGEVKSTIAAVITSMQATLKKGGKRQKLDGLRFEVTELENLQRFLSDGGSRNPRGGPRNQKKNTTKKRGQPE